MLLIAVGGLALTSIGLFVFPGPLKPGRPKTHGLGVRQGDPWANEAARRQWERAEFRYQEGRYSAAIAEYQHYLDQFGDLYFGDEAAKRIAECLVHLEQWDTAAKNYERLARQYRDSKHAPAALVEAGKLYEILKNYPEAVRVYFELIDRYYYSVYRLTAEERAREILTRNPESRWAADKLKQLEDLLQRKRRE